MDHSHWLMGIGIIPLISLKLRVYLKVTLSQIRLSSLQLMGLNRLLPLRLMDPTMCRLESLLLLLLSRTVMRSPDNFPQLILISWLFLKKISTA